jgi:hypothetical protein
MTDALGSESQGSPTSRRPRLLANADGKLDHPGARIRGGDSPANGSFEMRRTELIWINVISASLWRSACPCTHPWWGPCIGLAGMAGRKFLEADRLGRFRRDRGVSLGRPDAQSDRPPGDPAAKPSGRGMRRPRDLREHLFRLYLSWLAIALMVIGAGLAVVALLVRLLVSCAFSAFQICRN